MLSNDAPRQPVGRPANRGGGRTPQPGAPSGRPAIAATLSQRIDSVRVVINASRTRLGFNAGALQVLGSIVHQNADQIIAALAAVEEAAGSGGLPAIPFAWALQPREAAVFRALMTRTAVSPAEMKRIVNSASPQAERKVLLKLRRQLEAIAGVKIKTVHRRGHYLDAEAQLTLRRLMVSR